MKRRVTDGKTLLALAAATALVAWLGIDLADGSITRRHQVHTFPSLRFVLDLLLALAGAAILAVAWVRTLRRRSSR